MIKHVNDLQHGATDVGLTWLVALLAAHAPSGPLAEFYTRVSENSMTFKKHSSSGRQGWTSAWTSAACAIKVLEDGFACYLGSIPWNSSATSHLAESDGGHAAHAADAVRIAVTRSCTETVQYHPDCTAYRPVPNVLFASSTV